MANNNNNDHKEAIPAHVLQRRLDMGLGLTGGSRGSLTRVAMRLEQPQQNVPSCVVDLQLLQLELIKLVRIMERNQHEIANYSSSCDDDDTTGMDVVQDDELQALRKELESLQTTQACLQEYEALAKQTIQQQKTSEASLHTEIARMNSETQVVTNQLKTVTAATAIRQSQFQALNTCLQDLKCSLHQPLELQSHELMQDEAASANNNNNHASKTDQPTQDNNTTEMEVEEEEEEDGELYNDLNNGEPQQTRKFDQGGAAAAAYIPKKNPNVSLSVTRVDKDEDDEFPDEDDEFPDIDTFKARIQCNGQQVGQATLVLIERGSAVFRSTCDNHSSEMYRIASFIGDARGKAKHELSIHGYDQPGPFLYVWRFRIDESHRKDTFFGADAIRKILTHPLLRHEWTLAIYEPDSKAQMGEIESAAMESRLRGRQETHREQRAHRERIARLCRQDARQFLRACFRQVMPPSLDRRDYYHFFAVPAFLQENMLSAEDAAAVTIVDAPQRPLAPVGVDLQIREFVTMQGMVGVSHRMAGKTPPPRDYAQFEQRIRELVAEGGSIEK